MRNIFVLITTLFLCGFGIQLSYSQNATDSMQFSIMFYNVENLFDTIDNNTTNDNKYLPNSTTQWNTSKYFSKVKNISKVIIASGEWQTPDIISLAEIETKACAQDIFRKTALSNHIYNVVHFDSPDKRGIDVALAYNKETFKYIQSKKIPVAFTNKAQTKSRDILYVTGIIKKFDDTIHVFVCHFPSQLGGAEKSESKRIDAAVTLRKNIDSILTQNKRANICVIGDFNADYSSSIIQKYIGSQNNYNQECDTCLYTIRDSSALGTHVYKSHWSHIDLSMVSNNLQKKYSVKSRVIQNEMLFEKNPNSTVRSPRRSFKGNYYTGGFSDHLPIILRIKKKSINSIVNNF